MVCVFKPYLKKKMFSYFIIIKIFYFFPSNVKVLPFSLKSLIHLELIFT